MIKKFNQFLNENTTDYHEVIVPEGKWKIDKIKDNKVVLKRVI